ncbi:hypothetical protein Q4511_06910 [Paracoccus sp. 1_MG-2023]|uniref:hypothetical protein n=1 Tax=unclassified Paracoccus (in: a-proteobacteria) TaxID=2688777 RepID=UPI001C085C18|nr:MULTISPECIES: hypothetical protein [unclassified Paracoccus (in: a-proteobacteria)]MBU2956542.1 hypothetical protein [Paracoccus sp. C2R09]MDO6668648.1 hypothetical protein [Paracoccus sp. 1_MG-2023]
MKWHHVQENWSAFYEAITDKWPEADEADLDEIDGDQRAFVEYLTEVTGQEAEEIREEMREWLRGEIPSDIVMDPVHDDQSIRLSSKYVNEGEDEYSDDARFGDDGDNSEDG